MAVRREYVLTVKTPREKNQWEARTPKDPGEGLKSYYVTEYNNGEWKVYLVTEPE